jgi:hypothetical protein
MQYDTNSVFLIASPNISEPIYDSETKILSVPGNESLIPGILQKTIKGIQYCLDNFEFDILIRSNMSTIVNYNELNKQLTNITSIFGGQIISHCHILAPLKFISGCCTVMDKQVCNYLVTNQNILRYYLPDDVAMGNLLYKKIPITFTTLFSTKKTITKDICFYRFRKDLTRYDERTSDINDMSNFYKLMLDNEI